jgi:Ser/Thr protein kinase RdoA (MazF antagonist)
MTEELSKMQQALAWCDERIGPYDADERDPRFHGRTTVIRIRRGRERLYLKIYEEQEGFEAEVHAYEQWTQAIAPHAPTLVAARKAYPSALLLSALPGISLGRAGLSMSQQEQVWETAGHVLAVLHNQAQGRFFGACQRDGSPAGPEITDAVAYVSCELEREAQCGIENSYLTADELAVIERARALLPAFAGERPVPCHRDYIPVNWIVSPAGAWVGVIDFEFSRWDVRVSDLARYPDWQWLTQPNLVQALLRGYGWELTPQEEQQLLVTRVVYAVSAIVWGSQAAYHGFVREGREALRHLSGLLP